LDYAAPQAALQLRAPIFNYESLLRMRMARAQADGAQWVYEIRGMELVDRLGTAYLQVLLSTEGVRLARAEIIQLEGQLERSRQRLRAGEGTRTDVAQTQAQLELARVRLVESLDQLRIARRGIHRLTGRDPVQLRALPFDYLPAELDPPDLEAWQSLAEQRSPWLQARARNVEVARLATQRARAGHLPRLDLVASLSHSKNESISSLNQTSSLRSLGVQLSVPLYNGGGIDATVRQAVADGERVQEELRNERESVQLEVQRQYLLARNGRDKVTGFLRAVEAGELALQGMTHALAAGMATHADVLDAQTRVFAARRDVALARYEYLAARLRLALQSGLPMAEAVGEIDRQLTQPAPVDGFEASAQGSGGTR
jgi:protease secretion system outer membrane protein